MQEKNDLIYLDEGEKAILRALIIYKTYKLCIGFINKLVYKEDNNE